MYFLVNIKKFIITPILKVSLKILPPVYLHIIEKDIKQWTTTCLNF